MLQTVEAEIDINGNIHLLEPLKITKPSRALVTLLDNGDSSLTQKGRAESVLEFLRNNRLPDSARPSEEEIEAQITEARESWD